MCARRQRAFRFEEFDADRVWAAPHPANAPRRRYAGGVGHLQLEFLGKAEQIVAGQFRSGRRGVADQGGIVGAAIVEDAACGAQTAGPALVSSGGFIDEPVI
jgi:hypothetical protein